MTAPRANGEPSKEACEAWWLGWLESHGFEEAENPDPLNKATENAMLDSMAAFVTAFALAAAARERERVIRVIADRVRSEPGLLKHRHLKAGIAAIIEANAATWLDEAAEREARESRSLDAIRALVEEERPHEG